MVISPFLVSGVCDDIPYFVSGVWRHSLFALLGLCGVWPQSLFVLLGVCALWRHSLFVSLGVCIDVSVL